jgi:hypothetical protein
LTGARQTGKTSLLRALFPQHHYVTLDRPDLAQLAQSSPHEFLTRHPPPLLLDEVQYAPALFRHLKLIIDADRSRPGQLILTGSQKFVLMREVADSLAGRVGLAELEGLSAAELGPSASAATDYGATARLITRGSFPELWAKPALSSDHYFSAYLATYLERDLRQLLNVGRLRDFDRFIRVCAARNAQVLNQTEIAKDVGVSQPTIREWLSVLEASNQIVLLEPFFANVGKRLVKTPKLYFCDPGLVAWLLSVDATSLSRSPFAGALWETFVAAELRKGLKARGGSHRLFFYRDQHRREIDFVLQGPDGLDLVEVKWTELPEPADAANLAAVARLFEASGSPWRIGQQLVACRTPEPHPVAAARAVHGQTLAGELLGKRPTE